MLIVEIYTDVIFLLFGIEVYLLELIVKGSVGSGLSNHSDKTENLHYVSTHDDGQNRYIVVLQ